MCAMRRKCRPVVVVVVPMTAMMTRVIVTIRLIRVILLNVDGLVPFDGVRCVAMIVSLPFL